MKNDVVKDLFKAVQRYVESRGGTVLVAGGPEFIRIPGDLDYTYHIAVKCTGKPPEPPETSKRKRLMPQ